MRAGENIRNSFNSLLHNKLRSFLTMLGIMIGVSSVIMLTSIGQGIKEEVTAQVESLGSNLLYVLPGKLDITPEKGSNSKLGVQMGAFGQSKSTLTYQDVLDLKGISCISSVSGIYNGIDKLDALNINVSTTGVDEDFASISRLKLQYGRFFTKTERENNARVAVIGYQANKELFNSKNSIGKSFKLNGKDYKVVGVLVYKKPENMGPQSEDLNVKFYLPITEMLGRTKDENISMITANALSSQEVGAAEKTIREALQKHHLSEDFSVLKQQDMLDTVNKILNMLNASLAGIAAISLLVGGLGIMNIMLVSVTERTREIGIRKAIGAKRRHILAQFLVESVTLSLIGALVGLILGIGGSRLIPRAFPILSTSISLPAVTLSLVFAFFIGIFFGVYPAVKAAKLDPIAALRSE